MVWSDLMFIDCQPLCVFISFFVFCGCNLLSILLSIKCLGLLGDQVI
jgi:hypothetical protein